MNIFLANFHNVHTKFRENMSYTQTA